MVKKTEGGLVPTINMLFNDFERLIGQKLPTS
jgi:hypothetical protein